MEPEMNETCYCFWTIKGETTKIEDAESLIKLFQKNNKKVSEAYKKYEQTDRNIVGFRFYKPESEFEQELGKFGIILERCYWK